MVFVNVCYGNCNCGIPRVLGEIASSGMPFKPAEF